MLAPVLTSLLFESSIERAFTLARNSEWVGASAALDQAFVEDPSLFASNNFHYLRGRFAENQRDWNRARQEFSKVAPDNPLFSLAMWHAALASARLGDEAASEQSYGALPLDFPIDLKMQLARNSSPAFAMKIYASLVSREARLQRAAGTEDILALWSLIREEKADDVALEAVRRAGGTAATPRDFMDAAEVYAAHRHFSEAITFYERASSDATLAAEAMYQIARARFFQENYQEAIERYQEIAADFPETDWAKDATYQIANSYWRLGDFRNAEQTFLAYIKRYGKKGNQEGAVRDLVDVYRALGEHQKAVSWLDRMLAGKLSVSGRQVFLFTKAKILYVQKRFTAAEALFRRLSTMKLRAAAGGATTEEVKYFQALCLANSNRKAQAEEIWRGLMRESRTYYAQRAAEKLGAAPPAANLNPCAVKDSALVSVEVNLENLRRPLRTEVPVLGDPLTELSFLRLWDEASFWMDRQRARADARTGAEMAYAAGRYHRSIAYADRLPKTEPSVLPLLYPTGFRRIICSAAETHSVDPLWLHAIIWQESKYDPQARSGASARGLMQFIPETARMIAPMIGLKEFSLDRLYEPGVSIQLGARYWKSLMDEIRNPAMALAAYNGGMNNVRRWMSKAPDGEPELFVADIGFVETKRYVMAVFQAHAAYEALQ